jgi:carbonic anhydrase/acetyltransferase-like protein (isoleucine patch superfamily)
MDAGGCDQEENRLDRLGGHRLKSPHIPRPDIDPTAFVAPGGQVHGQVRIGPLTFVLFGAVLRGELDRIEVGRETNIQDNAIVHTDDGAPATLGDRVTIGHSAVVHGAGIGDRALIGIGALVLNRATVGEGAWLGAGSVLTEGSSIPAWTLAVGAPARPRRELTDEEVARADEGVDHYLEMMEAYRAIFAEEGGRDY